MDRDMNKITKENDMKKITNERKLKYVLLAGLLASTLADNVEAGRRKRGGQPEVSALGCVITTHSGNLALASVGPDGTASIVKLSKPAKQRLSTPGKVVENLQTFVEFYLQLPDGKSPRRKILVTQALNQLDVNKIPVDRRRGATYGPGNDVWTNGRVRRWLDNAIATRRIQQKQFGDDGQTVLASADLAGTQVGGDDPLADTEAPIDLWLRELSSPSDTPALPPTTYAPDVLFGVRFAAPLVDTHSDSMPIVTEPDSELRQQYGAWAGWGSIWDQSRLVLAPLITRQYPRDSLLDLEN
jgi:hypothetical protein